MGQISPLFIYYALLFFSTWINDRLVFGDKFYLLFGLSNMNEAGNLNSERAEFSFVLAYAGAFCSALCICMAGLIVFFRWHYPIPAKLLVMCLSIFIASVFSPFLLPAKQRESASPVPFKSFFLVFAMFFSPLLALLVKGWFGYAFPVIAVIAVLRAFPQFSKMRRSHLLFIFLAAPALAGYVFLVVQSRVYAHVYTPEHAVAGLLDYDTYFLTSSAHMIQNFKTASVGLDGLVRLHYHFGSQAWFAGLGTLAGTGPTYSYPFGLMIVGIPGFFFSLFAVLFLLAGASGKNVIGFVGFPVLIILGLEQIGLNSYYISESFTLSLTAFLLCLPLLLSFSDEPVARPFGDWPRFVLAAALVFGMCALKISVGLLWAAVIGWAWFRAHGLSLRTVAGLSVLALISAASINTFYTSPLSALMVSFGKYSRPFLFDYYNQLRLVAFTSMIVPFAFLACALVRVRVRGFRDLASAWRDRKYIHIELVLVLTVCAALPTILLGTSDGWFFVNVSQWFALPFLAASIPLKEKQSSLRVFATMEFILAISMVAVFVGEQLKFKEDWLGNLGRVDRGVEQMGLFKESMAKAKVIARSGRAAPRHTSGNSGLRTVEIIRPFSEKYGKDFAVFVTPDNLDFWWISMRCEASPFIVPSVLGVPLLRGVPPEALDCITYYGPFSYQYGFIDYGPESRSGEWDEESLCAHARERGINHILVLRDLYRRGTNLVIECDPGSGP